MLQQPVTEAVIARRYTLSGYVQGVGFRPFVYRLARESGIKGWVKNTMGQVVVHAEATASVHQQFLHSLLQDAPPHSSPRLVHSEDHPREDPDGFVIKESGRDGQHDIHIIQDLPVCSHCLDEMHDPGNRRHAYPFINCTECGPRYSLIRELPYDRQHTTMSGFELCEACRQEYENPQDRRFHAEPVACPECGPALRYDRDDFTCSRDRALQACVDDLHSGLVIAVKGISGFHLVCDAGNDHAVGALRLRKQRPDKPLAIMLTEEQLADCIDMAPTDIGLLRNRVHPVVILPAKQDNGLSQLVAPGLNEIGVMLPYSPLHHLLLEKFGSPLVCTSANLSGEPVLTSQHEVMARLGPVMDACLHHDRDIQRPADDPVYHVVAGQPRPLRLGRGDSPLEMPLPRRIRQPTLATGGHLKNTIALAWDRRVVISPHIGDLDSPRSIRLFQQTLSDLQDLYGVRATRVACDAHRDYASSRWARESGLPVQPAWHHHAHASTVAGEYPHEQHWLVFTWDGTGYGEDGTLWGGEALLGSPGAWRRMASMHPFSIPGAGKAGRQPWRSAAATCLEAGIEDIPGPGEPGEAGLFRLAWQRRLNSSTTTSVGRLFDAAASLLGLARETSFEGQAAMLLESRAAAGRAQALSLPTYTNGQDLLRLDWRPLLPMLTDAGLSVADRARAFHETLARSILDLALACRERHGDFAIGLTGGVFQNRLLTTAALHLLEKAGFRCYLPVQVPVNDGGLCYGQIIETLFSE